MSPVTVQEAAAGADVCARAWSCPSPAEEIRMFRSMSVRNRAAVTLAAAVVMIAVPTVEAARAADAAGWIVVQGLAFVLAISWVIWFFLTRAAVAPLDRVVELSGRVAAGDWDMQIAGPPRDE